MTWNRLISVTTLLLWLAVPRTLFGLAGDREQPIQLEADRVEIDERRGVSIYSGNVRLIQGSTHISGEKITVNNGKNGLETLVASGAPARFRQLPDGETREVVATAKKMEYQVGKRMLILTGNARLDKGQDQFSGAKLEYDMAKNLIRAKSVDGETGGKPQRIQMIIQPQTPTPERQ